MFERNGRGKVWAKYTIIVNNSPWHQKWCMKSVSEDMPGQWCSWQHALSSWIGAGSDPLPPAILQHTDILQCPHPGEWHPWHWPHGPTTAHHAWSPGQPAHCDLLHCNPSLTIERQNLVCSILGCEDDVKMYFLSTFCQSSIKSRNLNHFPHSAKIFQHPAIWIKFLMEFSIKVLNFKLFW